MAVGELIAQGGRRAGGSAAPGVPAAGRKPANGRCLTTLAPARPLRICHLGKFYPPASGGIESHLQTLARAQARLGHDLHVLCVNHLSRSGRDVTWEAFGPTPTTTERDGDVRVTRAGKRASIARFEVCPDLPRLLGGACFGRFDLLHLHVPNPTMLLGLAAARRGLPLVITYHSDVVKQKLLGKCVRPFEHLVFRRAAAVLATSPAYPAGSELLRAYRDKVVVVPFGIPLAPYLTPGPAVLAGAAALRERWGEPLWLAVGRFVYYKGLHNALHALTRVAGRLMLIGEGPLEGELRELARRLGVAERVVWRGRVCESELLSAYHAATAFWFPSVARSEAFGIVQVEAMACGCPVINTAVPHSGVSWVSQDGETGLTVPVNDPDALADAANRLLHEPGLRERLRRQARERAAREFDDAQMASRSLETYRAALAGGAAAGRNLGV